MYYVSADDAWYCSTCHVDLQQSLIDYDPDCGECDSRIYKLLVSGDHDASAL